MKSCNSDMTCYSITIPADPTNRFWLALLVIAVIFCVIGIVLWITVGVMVPNPPNGCKQKSIPSSYLLLMIRTLWVLQRPSEYACAVKM